MAGNAKMAKSTGNLVFVHDLLERWSAAAIRLLILSRPWNESWEFSESELDGTEGELETLRGLETKPGASDTVAQEVRRVLFENLDVPGALAVARDVGGGVLRHFDRLIGLTTVERWS
jgi:cysteinyl-tRNA synthetase